MALGKSGSISLVLVFHLQSGRMTIPGKLTSQSWGKVQVKEMGRKLMFIVCACVGSGLSHLLTCLI